MSTKRILVLGSSRSGSIWTARMLAASPNGHCVVEPDNVNTDGAAATSAFGPFPVLTLGQASPEYAALWKMAFAGRLPGRKGWLHPSSRLLLRLPPSVRAPLLSSCARLIGGLPGVAETVVVQTVMAQFAAEWIVDRFDPQVVMIQRDPMNVLSSWLEWGVHGFDLHTRPEVRRRCADLGMNLPPIGESDVSRTAWWIGLVTSALTQLAVTHPDWVVVSHETLCAEPLREFAELYATLGLAWTAQAERFLEETGYLVPNRRTHQGRGPSTGSPAAVRSQVTQKWRERLTADQVAEAGEVLEGFPTRGWISPAAAVTESLPATGQGLSLRCGASLDTGQEGAS